LNVARLLFLSRCNHNIQRRRCTLCGGIVANEDDIGQWFPIKSPFELTARSSVKCVR
jgi:hypothetical protein